MPELPEVENVKRSLQRQGLLGQTLTEILLRRSNLRTPLHPFLVEKLPGQTVRRLSRRAKFLLIDTDDYVLLSHLGMSGSWRFLSPSEELRAHDHVVIKLSAGKILVYNDPRRFGLLELYPRGQEIHSRWLDHLGPEPLSDEFSGDALFALTRARKTPIKTLIMAQKNVVGVGNIYASEALFQAGVKPTRQAARLTRNEAAALVSAIKKILTQSIHAGGSTIRDYRDASGESGKFQNEFLVYDRAGEPCRRCGQVLHGQWIGGRSSFWCKQCQR